MTLSSRKLFRSLLLLLVVVTALAQGQDDLTCKDNSTETEADGKIHEATNDTAESCLDDTKDCTYWASIGECDKNPSYMEVSCRKACKLCSNDTQEDGTSKVIEELMAKTREYMEKTVYIDPKYESVRKACKNRHAECWKWALNGDCETDAEFMSQKCAPVCQTCELLAGTYEVRCPIDAEVMPDAWGPGDLNRMFEIMVSAEEYQTYQPRVLSSPKITQKETNEDAPDGPWVVLLEKFATEQECETLIELGANQGFERSVEWGASLSDQVLASRTSSTAWCDDDCAMHPLSQGVMQKIANVTGIPQQNQEPLQLLKYDVGQFYITHSDCNYHEASRQQGVRILTVFFYLNEVEEGGGTDFPELGITVQPKRGSALIWPSVLDEDPNRPDMRTKHQALPVIKGEKYGANAWIHQRDFHTPIRTGCL